MVELIDCVYENVKFLLEHGAPAEIESNSFGTPLHYAVMLVQSSIVDLLAEHINDVDPKNKREMTPLEMAIRMENLFAIRSLYFKTTVMLPTSLILNVCSTWP